MLRSIAVIFGLAFLLIGVLGFLPKFTPDGQLLGLFQVNALHNVIHLISGAIFILVGMRSAAASLVFFRVFGVIYLLVAILGFFYRDQAILGLMSNNLADAWLHLGLSVIMLYIGLRLKIRTKS